MTPAQRQKASRAKRLAEKYESTQARQVNVLLSAQATQALDKLIANSDKSQKMVIEELLILAYAIQKNGAINISDKSQNQKKSKVTSGQDEAAAPLPSSQFTLGF